jgi:hypothetical protein
MAEALAHGEGADDLRVSLIRGDALFRMQRWIGLIPSQGLGIGRRALLFAAITWLPVAIWAVLKGRALAGSIDEPLLAHCGVHVRCLVAIPLLVVAEGVAHAVTMRLGPYFVQSGIVPDEERARLRDAVRSVIRLRDSTLPWIAIAGLVLSWTFASPLAADTHEVVWAVEAPAEPHLGFGGWWFFYVVRPVYLALLIGWVWRLLLIFLLLRWIAKLELALVPTHPDRAAGLGFLERLPSAFSLVALACSAVAASRWAHEIVYHGAHVASLRVYGIVLLVALVLVFVAPLLVFVPKLAAAKRQALLDYGVLVGEHGRLVRKRWITHEPLPSDEILGAPEIGPVADTIALYEAVKNMRPAPIGMSSLLMILLPAVVPLLIVTAIEIPIRDLLLKLVKTLA